MKLILGAALILMTTLVATKAQVGDFRALSSLYDYDATQALDTRQTLLYQRSGVRVYDISYASPKGGRVTAYLVVPSGKGPFAGVVFGHWGPGNRTEFLPEATLYAEAGVVSLLVDYPWVRPAPWRKKLQNVANASADHETFVQAVVDLRRGFDMLAARADVDAKRLAYVGHSYGAQWGAILSAIDRRIKAAVLMGGIPDRAAIFLESQDPDIVELRASTPPEKLEEYLRVNARTDAIHYVGHAAPTPLYFQFAKHERYFNEAAMKRYAAAASEPKQVSWYESGHDLNDLQALLDRADWLRAKIGTRPVAPLIRQKLRRR